jgi:tetraacyldisaccharide 4'-kinase
MSWGNPETTQEKLLSTLLLPAAAGFGIGLYARLMAYNLKFLKQKKFAVPVISIGNITVGGTGKTPVTIDVATRLIEAGHKVGILSRGYKRLSKQPMLVVSDGRGDLQSCGWSGDEPYLIAKAVPQAVVIVGSKRVQTAQLAVEKFKCDVLLLDDGFQHWPIARTTDVVLVDYNDDLTKDHLLPAGRLREPLAALSRADWVVVTKVPESPDLDRLIQIRSTIGRYAPQAQITSCRMSPYAVQCIGSGDSIINPTALNGMKVLVFSGIARPQVFEAQLRDLGVTITSTLSFPDHHWYTQEDVAKIQYEYQVTGADLIITTEKDAVKLQPAFIKDLPVATLQQRIDWLGPIPTQPNQINARSEQKLVTS